MTSNDKTQHFSPGENFTINSEWKRKAFPLYDKAEVAIPGRLHFGVLDFSKMSPGLGGGGIGISTDTVSYRLVFSREKNRLGECDIPTGRHLLELFKSMTNYYIDDISIRIDKNINYKHSGFGSNVAFNTAVISGLNALFGSPFSIDEVWNIVTQNYVENAEDKENIYFGLDTGVGEACFLYGGLVWVDSNYGQGRFINNVSCNDLWVVTAVGDRVKLTGDILRHYGEGAALSDTTETDLVASHFMACEKRYGKDFKAFIRNEMCPALLSNDLEKVLNLGWKMNEMSNLKVLEGIYKTEILQAINQAMKEAGALYAGMSSAGPGFFAFAGTQAEAEELKRVIENGFGEYFGHCAIGKAGNKLSIKLTPQKKSPELKTIKDNALALEY